MSDTYFVFPFNHVKRSGDFVRLEARVDLVGGPKVASVRVANWSDEGVAFWSPDEQEHAMDVARGVYAMTYAHMYGIARS